MGAGQRATRRGTGSHPEGARQAFQVELEPEAEEELTEAFRWYELHYPGRGHRLHVAIRRILEIVASAPLLFPERDGVRAAPVDRFPYVVHYVVIDDATVRVRAVTHTSRHPRTWVKHR